MIKYAIIFLIILANTATAEVIALRGGEHDSFTRLVVDLPVGRDWQIGRTATGYVFDTGLATDSFDLSRAFDRIPRDRIVALGPAAGSGQLAIDMTCDCHAQAFLWRPDQLVIDIVDGPAPGDAPFEVALFAMPILSVMQSAPAERVLPLIMTPNVVSEYQSGPTEPSLPATMTDQAETAIVPGIAEGQRISEAEQAIIESFARAASQGLLDVAAATVAPDESGDHGEENETMSDYAVSEAPIPEPESHAVVSAGSPTMQTSGLAAFEMAPSNLTQPGITARTSVDRVAPLIGTTGQTDPEGAACLDGELVNTDDWGDERDYSTQIAERLGALTTEFDAYPDGAVEALARTYLYFGFGREAIQALELDGRDSQERRVLTALAYLIDMEPDLTGIFAAQLGCATPTAVWTALARGTLDDTQESERSAASQGFRGLPPMVRGHLGARLAQIFLDFGDSESAETIMETARGELTADSVQTDLTIAEIALETEGPEAAIEVLTVLAEEDTRATPEGLVELIDLTLSEGRPVATDMIELAATMHFENRGEAVAADLIRVQAEALIANDAFPQAFDLLQGDTTPMTEQTLAQLRAEAVLALTDRATDSAFLNFAFNDLPLTYSATVENAVAARLVGLGFADRAAVLLITPAVGADDRDRRYLRAEIAVILGQFDAVDGLLGGLSDPRAGAILAQALAGQGDFTAAISTQQTLPGAIADPAEAWRAGDWATLENSDDSLLRAASDAVQTGAAGVNAAAPLASGRALLDEATQTRDLAGQLLERFVVDPAPVEPANN